MKNTTTKKTRERLKKSIDRMEKHGIYLEHGNWTTTENFA